MRRRRWRAQQPLALDPKPSPIPHADPDAGPWQVAYSELNDKLRQGMGHELAKRNLNRAPKEQADRSRLGKVNAKNINMNYTVARVAVLPEHATKLDASSGVPVQEQLKDILKEYSKGTITASGKLAGEMQHVLQPLQQEQVHVICDKWTSNGKGIQRGDKCRRNFDKTQLMQASRFVVFEF